MSSFRWRLRGCDVESCCFFSRTVGRLRQKQVGDFFQSSRRPSFGSPILLDGILYQFLSLQVQVVRIKRRSAKNGLNHRPFASNQITEHGTLKEWGSTFLSDLSACQCRSHLSNKIRKNNYWLGKKCWGPQYVVVSGPGVLVNSSLGVGMIPRLENIIHTINA